MFSLIEAPLVNKDLIFQGEHLHAVLGALVAPCDDHVVEDVDGVPGNGSGGL